MATRTTEPDLIVSQAGLDQVVNLCGRAGRAGLDTEFLREKTYRARLCLIQIAIPDEVFVVDPLARLDLSGLARIVADESVQVVLHAGKQDLEILWSQFGCVPGNIYDIQIAAGFAGYGASLPYGRLVEELLAVRLEKGESYSDWCRRPLSGSQLRYAADDVRYLMDAADKLERELTAIGRATWAAEEMASLHDPATYENDPAESWRRVSGRGALSPAQTAVLRALAAWREETAARRDIPRGWVVKDPTLIEIARRAPGSVEALKKIRGMNPRDADRYGAAIIAAVERGKTAPPIDMGTPPPKQALVRARTLVGLADAIVRARCEAAGVATELVATRSELEAVLAHVVAGTLDRARHRMLNGWRAEIAGNAVIDLARGKIAIRAIEHPPYIEEMPL